MPGISAHRSTRPTTPPPDIRVHFDSLRQVLEEKRRQLLALYRHDLRVGQESNDENFDDSLDRANNSFNRELMFLLSDNEREVLILIDEAFQRLEKGSYGCCSYCRGTISLPRLRALPWARYCIDCQESEERGALED